MVGAACNPLDAPHDPLVDGRGRRRVAARPPYRRVVMTSPASTRRRGRVRALHASNGVAAVGSPSATKRLGARAKVVRARVAPWCRASRPSCAPLWRLVWRLGARRRHVQPGLGKACLRHGRAGGRWWPPRAYPHCSRRSVHNPPAALRSHTATHCHARAGTTLRSRCGSASSARTMVLLSRRVCAGDSPLVAFVLAQRVAGILTRTASRSR